MASFLFAFAFAVVFVAPRAALIRPLSIYLGMFSLFLFEVYLFMHLLRVAVRSERQRAEHLHLEDELRVAAELVRAS
jgi:cbb3-type cytochrome oxidase subunit 3